MGLEHLLRQLSVKSGNWKKVSLSWTCVSVMGRLSCVFHAHNGSHVWEIVFRQHDCDTDVCALKLNQYTHTDTHILHLSPHEFVMCELSYCTPGKVNLHWPSQTCINKTACSSTHKAHCSQCVWANKWSVYETLSWGWGVFVIQMPSMGSIKLVLILQFVLMFHTHFFSDVNTGFLSWFQLEAILIVMS